jgi:hypothetical protein
LHHNFISDSQFDIDRSCSGIAICSNQRETLQSEVLEGMIYSEAHRFHSISLSPEPRDNTYAQLCIPILRLP